LRYKDWTFYPTEKGWISDEVALAWLQHTFIPETSTTPQRPRLLIVDGHGSHETDDFMWNCYYHNIHLLFLPAHTSHVLQPLDVGVFSPLKTAYRREIGNLYIQSDETPIGKRAFLMCYFKARAQGLADRNIRAGWKATGLWPVNEARALASPYVFDKVRQDLTSATPGSDPTPGPEINLGEKRVVLATPEGSRAIRDFLIQAEDYTKKDPVARSLIEKLGKALDKKNYRVAVQESQIQALQARIPDKKLQTRKKVVREDPNEKFAKIEDVIHTRQALQEVETAVE
jgi:hypothetical protein